MADLKSKEYDYLERSLDLLKGLLLTDDSLHKTRLRVSFKGHEEKTNQRNKNTMIGKLTINVLTNVNSIQKVRDPILHNLLFSFI